MGTQPNIFPNFDVRTPVSLITYWHTHQVRAVIHRNQVGKSTDQGIFPDFQPVA
jgi:hypothetical protein